MEDIFNKLADITRPLPQLTKEDAKVIFHLLKCLMKEVSVLNKDELSLYYKIKPYLPEDYIGMIKDLETKQKENSIS